MTKSKKVDLVQKRDGHKWSFLHPMTQQWTGAFSSRKLARDARDAAKKTDSNAAAVEFADALLAGTNASDVVNTTTEKVVDNAQGPNVDSLSHESTTSPVMSSNANPVSKDNNTMAQITLVKSDKVRKSTSVVYTATNGLRGSVRFAKTFFVGGTAPGTLTVDSDAFAEPKQKLTAEQRKEARKNAPKLTPAQKLEKLQERAAKLQAKIDAQNAAPVDAAPAQ